MGTTFEQKDILKDISRMHRRISALESKRMSNRQLSITVGVTLDGNTDFTDIQDAIDYVVARGGGTVEIKNGTYLLDSDIDLAPDVLLTGETRTGVILDFQDGAYQIKAHGTNVYNTGTIAINNGDTTVVGSGTTWTVAMIGQIIFVGAIPYEILNVVDTTHITIDVYDGNSISGLAYAIADVVDGVNISNLTIQNSTDAEGALSFKYVSSGSVSDITVISSTIGIDFEVCSSMRVGGFDVYFCETGVNVTLCGGWTFNDWFAFGCTTATMILDRMLGCSISNFGAYSGNNGLVMSGCDEIGLYDFAIYSNSGVGIQLSGTNGVQITMGSVRYSGSDGIKLMDDSNNIFIGSSYLKNNTGYGVNISEADCDKNTVVGCHFVSNTAGTINNLGTSSILDNNQT